MILVQIETCKLLAFFTRTPKDSICLTKSKMLSDNFDFEWNLAAWNEHFLIAFNAHNNLIVIT